MKHSALLLTLLLLSAAAVAQQNVTIVDDEECGCELIYVDGIETTRSGDLYGFRRADGTVIAPNIYRYVDQFHGAYCKVLLDDTLVGIIDTAGRQVVPCLYDDVQYPAEGRVMVVKHGRVGYTDLRGRLVIPLQYTAGGSFSEGCAAVSIALDSFFSSCTFIDTLGRQLFPPQYESLSAFSNGFALVRQYERWGLIDHQGRIVLPTVYDFIMPLDDTLFFASQDEGMALFDARMQPLTPFVYTWASDRVSNGRIAVVRDGKYGFLDRRGREVVPCSYDLVGIFGLNRAMVCIGDRFGIIDTAGRIVLPIEYESLSSSGDKYYYSDSLAMVEKDGKVGYVDLDGKLVIPFYFSDGYQFSEGLASVRYGEKWGYIDTRGEVFMPFIFDLASPYLWGRASVHYNGAFRKVDRRGRCVRNCNGIIAWRNWNE